jgi:hypothetical protein
MSKFYLYVQFDACNLKAPKRRQYVAQIHRCVDLYSKFAMTGSSDPLIMTFKTKAKVFA